MNYGIKVKGYHCPHIFGDISISYSGSQGQLFWGISLRKLCQYRVPISRSYCIIAPKQFSKGYCLDFKSVSSSILITCIFNAYLNFKSQVNSLKMSKTNVFVPKLCQVIAGRSFVSNLSL